MESSNNSSQPQHYKGKYSQSNGGSKKRKATSNHVSSNAVYYPTESEDPEDPPQIYDSQPFTQERVVMALNIMPDPPGGYPTQLTGRWNQKFYCKKCKGNKISELSYEMGTGSWIWSLGCLLMCCFLSPLAFCCKSLQDAVHRCPDCGREVGRSRFLYSS